MLVTRSLGVDTDGMLIVARFVVLAMYVALVAFAIARSPRSKWAFCAAGLVPVAVFQSASSISHDAFTTAIALVVVSSALRALDPPEGTSTRALVIEALVLSALLGSVKPAYVVVAGLYLLPLLGPRRRSDRWPLVFAPVLGVIVTVLWTSSAGNVWKTDAGYFNITVDDVTQKHELLHHPWDFGVALLRTGYHELWPWVHQPFTVGPSVARGPAILAVLAIAIYAVSSVQRARTEARGAAPLAAADPDPAGVRARCRADRRRQLPVLDGARHRRRGWHPTPLLHAAARALARSRSGRCRGDGPTPIARACRSPCCSRRRSSCSASSSRSACTER